MYMRHEDMERAGSREWEWLECTWVVWTRHYEQESEKYMRRRQDCCAVHDANANVMDEGVNKRGGSGAQAKRIDTVQVKPHIQRNGRTYGGYTIHTTPGQYQ
jgi:hypothetical protein